MRNPFYNRKFALTYAIVWAIMIISQTFVLIFVVNADVPSAIIQSVITNTSFAALGFGIWFLARYNINKKSAFQTAIVFAVAGILVLAFWMGFNFVVMSLISRLSEGYFLFHTHPFYAFTTGVFLYTILLLVYRLLILFYKYAEKARSEEKLKKLVTETKLQALKAYVNPHFLFNSLNSVNALIMTNQEQAREMLVNLSEYFRYSLRQKDNALISLAEEIHYTMTYFSIERLRFGDKLVLNTEICEKCNDVKVPVMILQPLFENIVKHAVSESLGVITVDFVAHLDDDYLVISITNNYEPDAISKKGTGLGLQTTYDRISLIYHHKDLMNYSKNNGIFTVTLKIPVAK